MINRYFLSSLKARATHLSLALVLLAGIAWVVAMPRTRADQGHRHFVYNSSGFEPRPFVAGEPLLGVDGWSTAIPPFLNPGAAVISDDAGATGRQAVEVWGGDLVGSEGITDPYDAVGSYRRPVNYAVDPRKPIVVIEADLRLETEQPATDDDFFSMTIAAISDEGNNIRVTLGEMALSSDGTADVYGFAADPGDPTVFRTPAALNRWHRLSLVLDYSGETTVVSYWLDGQFIFATPTESTSKILLRGSLVVYARLDGGGEKRADYTARFDNFRIAASPTND